MYFVKEKNKRIKISDQISELSTLIKECNDNDDEVIIKVGYSDNVISYVTELCIHYKNEPYERIPEPVTNKYFDSTPQVWYKEFLEKVLENGDYKELLKFISYLDIEPVLKILYAFIAYKVNGEKEKEKILKKFI